MIYRGSSNIEQKGDAHWKCLNAACDSRHLGYGAGEHFWSQIGDSIPSTTPIQKEHPVRLCVLKVLTRVAVISDLEEGHFNFAECSKTQCVCSSKRGALSPIQWPMVGIFCSIQRCQNRSVSSYISCILKNRHGILETVISLQMTHLLLGM